MKKLNDNELAAALCALVAGTVVLSQRSVTWTEYKTVRVSPQYWENDLDSKFNEILVTRERTGYFLGDEEIEAGICSRLRALVRAYEEAPAIIARLREIEAAPGWEWIDHASRKAMYGDRLSELVPQARVALERALSDMSLCLDESTSTARWRLDQGELHLAALTVAKEREVAGCIPYFGGWLHTSGHNGRARFWVVRPDGTLRVADRDEYSRSHQRGAHTQWWELVEPDELGLWWSKSTNASEHAFEVRKLPQGGMCTAAQLATVARVEAELEKEWAGRTGLASGRQSPSVGEGWGLCKKPGLEPDPNSPFAVLARLKR